MVESNNKKTPKINDKTNKKKSLYLTICVYVSIDTWVVGEFHHFP